MFLNLFLDWSILEIWSTEFLNWECPKLSFLSKIAKYEAIWIGGLGLNEKLIDYNMQNNFLKNCGFKVMLYVQMAIISGLMGITVIKIKVIMFNGGK